MPSLKRTYSSLIIFAILSILLVAFVIVPIFKEIQETSDNIFSEKNKIFYLKEEKQNIQKIKNIYKTYQPDLDKMESLFFNPEVPIDFIGFLEKAASDSQVKLQISSMTKKTEKEDVWPSLSLQVLITGSFSNFSKFLDKIENGNYLIEVIDLNTRKLGEKEASAKDLENIPKADTTSVLSIKVFTQ